MQLIPIEKIFSNRDSIRKAREYVYVYVLDFHFFRYYVNIHRRVCLHGKGVVAWMRGNSVTDAILDFVE